MYMCDVHVYVCSKYPAANNLDDLLKEWGLTLSIVKTKLMVAGGGDADDMKTLKLDGGKVECVT